MAGSGGAASAAPAASGPPVSVTTVVVQKRDVDVMLEATGTVTALNSVDIRPQMASIITKVQIKEGQYVNAGQPLFALDARTDEVNVTKARAQLAKDEAALADAERQLARSKDLFAQNFISQGAVDTNQTLVDSARAVVAADKAAIESAQVGLSYSRIVAPAAGRAGAINVFPGSTVQPGGAALVTITQLDPIAVSFSLPQRNLGDALATLRSGGGKVSAILPDSAKVVDRQAQLRRQHGRRGVGDGPSQGRIREQGRATLAGRVRHGAAGGADAEGRERHPAGGRDREPARQDRLRRRRRVQGEARPVEIVYASGEEAVVSGVKPGERVVLDGRQNLRPGALGDRARLRRRRRRAPTRRCGFGRGRWRIGSSGGRFGRGGRRAQRGRVAPEGRLR